MATLAPTVQPVQQSSPPSPQKPPSGYALQRCYYPSLVTLDALVTTANELVYKKEYDSQRAVEAALRAIQAADYQGPDSETWAILTTLLDVRNEIAHVCNIRARTRLEDPPFGYTLDPPEDKRLQLPKVDSAKLHMGGLPCSLQAPQHIGGVPASLAAASLPATPLEECYLPILMHTDYVASKLEQRIWDDEYKVQKSQDKTQAAIWLPSYAAPNALRRNKLLEVRNVIATILGTPVRDRVHDFRPSGNAPWYLAIDGQPELNTGDEIETTKLHLAP